MPECQVPASVPRVHSTCSRLHPQSLSSVRGAKGHRALEEPRQALLWPISQAQNPQPVTQYPPLSEQGDHPRRGLPSPSCCPPGQSWSPPVGQAATSAGGTCSWFGFAAGLESPRLFSCSLQSDSLRPQGLQHVRLLCPSPSGVCSNSRAVVHSFTTAEAPSMHGGVPRSGETSRTRIEFRLDSKEPPGGAEEKSPPTLDT